jgi:hypothetical protein
MHALAAAKSLDLVPDSPYPISPQKPWQELHWTLFAVLADPSTQPIPLTWLPHQQEVVVT